MPIIYQDGAVVIRVTDVGAATTVIAFSSKGLLTEPAPQNEYLGLIRLINRSDGGHGKVNLVNVTDLQRSFYINGMSHLIIDKVSDVLDRSHVSRAVTIGSSMGGFAAVAFARHFPRCDTAIGLGAHSAVHPEVVPFDRRSPDLRSRIDVWDVVDCLDELSRNVRYRLFYGELDEVDRQHAARFAGRSNSRLQIRTIAGCEHNVLAHWMRQGQIEANLRTLFHLCPNMDLPDAFGQSPTSFAPP